MGSDVKYAKSGDVHIAYRVFGDGPRDLVLIPGTLSHADLYWEFPVNQYLLKRLTSFARLIVFDKRARGSPIVSPSRRLKSASATCVP
jgi:pimeloyl-ACP methyl ester carboxylesterase